MKKCESSARKSEPVKTILEIGDYLVAPAKILAISSLYPELDSATMALDLIFEGGVVLTITGMSPVSRKQLIDTWRKCRR